MLAVPPPFRTGPGRHQREIQVRVVTVHLCVFQRDEAQKND